MRTILSTLALAVAIYGATLLGATKTDCCPQGKCCHAGQCCQK
jgi:hypothetical protein